MTEQRITWEAWRELEGATPIAYGSLSARRLPDGVLVLAIDHQGGRHVLIPIDSMADGFSDARSRGMTVVARELEVEGDPQRPFLDVACTDATSLEAFDVVASMLVEEVSRGTPPAGAVRETLARWRRFWGDVPEQGLSPDQVLGLFGELWFLLVWLLPHGSRMVEHWVGATGARDDFQWPGVAVEAKATTSIRGHIHRINGIDQLDSPEGGTLWLFSLRVRGEPASTNSLVSLKAAITAALANAPEQLDLFERRLGAAGYSPAHAERYDGMRFRVVGERLYRVEQDFPRLSASSIIGGIPRGIERVEYEINLEGFPDLVVAETPDGFVPPD